MAAGAGWGSSELVSPAVLACQRLPVARRVEAPGLDPEAISQPGEDPHALPVHVAVVHHGGAVAAQRGEQCAGSAAWPARGAYERRHVRPEALLRGRDDHRILATEDAQSGVEPEALTFELRERNPQVATSQEAEGAGERPVWDWLQPERQHVARERIAGDSEAGEEIATFHRRARGVLAAPRGELAHEQLCERPVVVERVRIVRGLCRDPSALDGGVSGEALADVERGQQQRIAVLSRDAPERAPRA